MITKTQAEAAIVLVEQYMREQVKINPPVDDHEGGPIDLYDWNQDTPHIQLGNAWAKRILQAACKDPCGGCILCCS